jgi:hypothetical protein
MQKQVMCQSPRTHEGLRGQVFGNFFRQDAKKMPPAGNFCDQNF